MSTDLFFKVKPVAAAEARTLISQLATTQNNPLNKLFQEGDLVTCTEYVNTVAAVVNSDSKTSLSGACLLACVCFLCVLTCKVINLGLTYDLKISQSEVMTIMTVEV